MSALALKLIALVCMTMDHIGYLVPSLSFLRIPGRLAFPIYVFLLTVGFTHTSSRLRYALRLGLFALLSQLPFSLLFHTKELMQGELWRVLLQQFIQHGNVLLTFTIAILCLWLVASSRKSWRFLAWALVVGVYVLYLLGLISMDYGTRCLPLILVFYYLRKHPVWMCLSACLAMFLPELLHYGLDLFRLASGTLQQLQPPSNWTLMRLYSLAALLPISLYHGKKGWSPGSRAGKKLWQYAFYAYYPVHLLMLFFLYKI